VDIGHFAAKLRLRGKVVDCRWQISDCRLKEGLDCLQSAICHLKSSIALLAAIVAKLIANFSASHFAGVFVKVILPK